MLKTKRLTELRKKAELTQEEIAQKLNIKRQTYGAYERGVSLPDSNTLKEIATILGCTTDYLLGLTDHSMPLEVMLKNNIYINKINTIKFKDLRTEYLILARKMQEEDLDPIDVDEIVKVAIHFKKNKHDDVYEEIKKKQE